MSIITERHDAVVVDNDPEEDKASRRGRIKVACVGLMGDEDTAIPMLLEPVHDWGWFYIPDVGEQVEIEVVRSSSMDEVAGQAFLEEPDIRWRSKRYYGGEEADDKSIATPINDIFKTNYGKRRGFATPMGHFFVFDDTEGKTQITLSWINKDKKVSTLDLDPTGSISLTVLDKTHNITLLDKDGKGEFHANLASGAHSIDMVDADKKVTITLDSGSHSIVLDGTAKKLDIKIDSGAALHMENKDADAVMTVGDGAKHVAIVEYLKTLYNNLKTEITSLNTTFNSHTHSVSGVVTAGSPTTQTQTLPVTSAPPTSPSTANFPSWDSSIESTKISIPDG